MIIAAPITITATVTGTCVTTEMTSAVAKSLMPSASERVIRKITAATFFTRSPKRRWSSSYNVKRSPRKYVGMKITLMITRPITYPNTSCRNVISPAYAVAGTPMKVSVLVSVATMVKQIAHQGTERPVRK